ncbi:hypothetical protein HDU84_000496 [Entophlyctis sp. JEL0112]|nr:hypothetical protein HDU84_000496 [Entophlyctis sp. JEL0112]
MDRCDPTVTKSYRTIDQLENFKIKVTLRKVADRRVPLSRTNHGTLLKSDDACGFDSHLKDTALHLTLRNDLNPGAKSVESLPQPEVRVVRWQKKIWSPKELALKSKASSRKKDSSKNKTNEDLEQTMKVASQGGMFIFTHIDSEKYIDLDEVNRQMTTGSEGLSEMAKRVLTLGLANEGAEMPQMRYNELHDLKDLSRTRDIISDRPEHLYKPVCDTNYKEMHIMAFLFSQE